VHTRAIATAASADSFRYGCNSLVPLSDAYGVS
jgi:hypothetical protein